MSRSHNRKLSDRLLRYSAAASLVASGSLVLGVQSSLATPIVTYSGGDTMSGFSFNADPIDLDQNGTEEFGLQMGSSYIIGFDGAQSVNLLGTASGNDILPYALSSGVSISAGASGTWKFPTRWAVFTNSSGAVGNWAGLSSIKYVGVRFWQGTGWHYGWIELSVDSASREITIHRYAWNDEANASIIAGQPAGTASVALTSTQAAGNGLPTVAASLLAALGGVLTWIRRKVFQTQ